METFLYDLGINDALDQPNQDVCDYINHGHKNYDLGFIVCSTDNKTIVLEIKR